MQKQSRDWLIAAITLGVGVTATVVVPSGKVGSALLGSTTGAVIGATVLNKRKGKIQQESEVRLKQLEAQVLKQEEWETLEAKLPGLKATVNQLRQEKAELSGLKATVDQLRQEKADLARISGQITQRQQENRALTSAIANLTQQQQELEQQRAAKNIELTGVNGQLVHRQGELQLLNRQHEQARQKLEALTQQQGVAFDRLSIPQAELVSINAQLNAMSPEVERLRQAYATLTQQNQNKEQQVAARNSELAGVNGQLIHRQSELELLNRQHEQARQEREVLASQQHLATERLSTLQAELAFITAQLSALNPEVERLYEQKRSLVNVDAQLAVRQAEFTQLEPRVQALEKRAQELAQQSAELELLRATYDGLFSERQSLENRINSLNPEIARLETERRLLEQAIETQADKYANSLQLLQEIKDLKRTKNRLRREQNEQEAENSHLKDESAHLTRTLRELQEQISNVESKLGDTNRRVETALEALKQSPWSESELQKSQGSAPLDEKAFIDNFVKYIKDKGFNFPERVIRAFHTSLKVQDISAIVVLAGISGTGKSELPQLYAKYVGALPLVLAVQPRWDSPQDLLGFYNYMEDKFKPTPLIQGIYQYNHSKKLREQERMVIVLLDEMNLARVEYYFSEFLSKLEARRNNDAYLDIDLGSLPLTDGERHYRIPKEFLFVGTMNEDETTQTLSDKVLDRANVITFGKPEQLVLGRNGSNPINNSGYLTYSQFTTWIKSADPTSPVVQKVSEVLNKANKVMEALGHPFAHRVYQAITQYVVNYPGVEDENSEAFIAALADQFGQKLLPKLRGIMTDDEHVKTNLRQLKEIIASINDEALTTAFDRACLGYQFQWKGLVYPGSQTDGQ